MRYSITFSSRLEAASDVMSGNFVRLVVLNKAVKFRDPRLNHSREIRPNVVEGGIFDSGFRDNCRSK